MKLYKTTDRIKVKIGDLEVSISPLTYEQKIEVQTILSNSSKPDDIYKGSLLAMRYGIKEIKGLELTDGSKYELNFDEGILTEECAKELLNIEMNAELMAVCNSFADKIPQQINIKGVEIVNPKKKGKK